MMGKTAEEASVLPAIKSPVNRGSQSHETHRIAHPMRGGCCADMQENESSNSQIACEMQEPQDAPSSLGLAGLVGWLEYRAGEPRASRQELSP